MKCEKCNNDLSLNDKYCMNCGELVKTDAYKNDNFNKEVIKKNKPIYKVFKVILTILKIVFFYIYVPYLIIKLIVKLIFKLSVFIIKKIVSLIKSTMRLGRTLMISIINHKTRSLIVLCLLIIMTFLGVKINGYIDNYNKILLLNKGTIQTGEYEYTVNKKTGNIVAKLYSMSSIEKTHVKLYSGNFVIFEDNYKSKKKWSLKNDYLVEGLNVLDIDITYKEGNKDSKTIYIFNKSKDNLRSLDTLDTDGDKLLNYEEDINGTNKNKKDTDEDGLSDYEELYITNTNPNNKDSNSNGISDGLEDIDSDGIDNKTEIDNKTSPIQRDTDGDGLSDYEELYTYGTNPTLKDTDQDHISDYDEIKMGLNPVIKNDKVNISKKFDNYKVTTNIEGINGKQLESLSIEKITRFNGFDGLLCGPYDININGTFDNATLSFELDSISPESNPTIYHIDEFGNINELMTTVSKNTVSAHTTHFSEYVVLDKNTVENNKELAPNIDDSNIDDETMINTDYLVIAFPILNALNLAPIHVLLIEDTLDNYNIENKRYSIEYDGSKLNIELSTISRFAAKVLDFFFKKIETDVINAVSESADPEDKNFILKLLDFFYIYGHEYDSNQLKLLLGDNIDILKHTKKLKNKKEDRNKDGIPDYYTKLITSGRLTTEAGSNPFKGVTYSQIQKNRDFDSDGLINGEEISIIEKNGKLYLLEKSSPIKKDTDGDEVLDKYDKSPLKKFNDKYKIVSNINYIPSTPLQDRFEQESNKVYATKNEYNESSYSRAKLQASAFGKMPAANALTHFLDNTGSEYSFDNDWSLLNTYRGKESLALNTNDMMQIAEETLLKHNSITIATKEPVTGASFGPHLDDLADIGWWYAIGKTQATATTTLTNIDDQNYKMTLYYNIVDYYDWDKEQTFTNGGFGGLISDAEMFELHESGVARQYRVNIRYKMEVTWKKGDRYYLNKIYLYNTPNSLKVTKLKN